MIFNKDDEDDDPDSYDEVLERYLDRKSKQYEKFKEEEQSQKKLTPYERLCNFSESIVSIEPEDERAKDFEEAINFAHLNITPTGAYTFAILTGIFLVLLSMFLFIINVVSLFFLFLGSFLGIVSIPLLMQYPQSLKGIYKVRAADEIVLAVIYIAIYMRSTPNLDGAVRFAAEHLRGPLADDFKQLMWDVETRKYPSVSAALTEYMEKWQDSKSFVQSINTIKNATKQAPGKREEMLDEAVDTMMEGSREEMKSYANSLQLPVMIIHALGIMLPVMVLVMFPIIVMIMDGNINPVTLAILYNIILPVIIYFTSRRTLEYRPMGISTPDVSMHPKYESLDRVKIFGKSIKILPISVVISTIVIVIGIYLYITIPTEGIFEQMALSTIITWGIGIGPISYFYLSYKNKIGIRDRIVEVEKEFSEAVFSLGNKLSMGKPVVNAMEDAVRSNRELKISGLFEKALNNIKRSGMNLKKAFFDQEYGAVWDFPSRMIVSIMRITLQSTRKGVQMASVSLISISEYLKQIHEVEEELKNMLSSQTTSMKFLGGFLGPLVAGVTVGMAGIMMSIFTELGGQAGFNGANGMNGMGGAAGMGGMGESMLGGWGNMQEVMPPALFQIIVGIYVIQVTYLLSFLSSGVEEGPSDKISKRQTASLIMFVGLIVFTIALIVTWQIFGSQIEALVMS